MDVALATLLGTVFGFVESIPRRTYGAATSALTGISCIADRKANGDADAKTESVAPGHAYLMHPDAPLWGRDKWLGGVLGSDGNIYGVPGHSRHVLMIEPGTDRVSTIGGPFEGKYKWLRGVTARDNCVYCIPCHAETVLKIDCNHSPPVMSEIGGEELKGSGEWKWHGGVLSPIDGCIYGIPQFSETVLKIDPATQEVSTLGGPFPGASPTGKHKWYGGLLGGDGCIYGIPQCAETVLKIDPAKQEVTTIGKLEPGGWKWHGGVVGRDGCIYGIPSNSDAVLKVDPFKQEVTTLPFKYTCHHRFDGKYKYLGGVLGPDGCVYAIPSDADHVLRINPATGECDEIGESLAGRVSLDCNKWQNGFLAKDGKMYGIPLKADSVLCIDPVTEEVTTVGSGFKGFEKWEGGVLADGAMYCMPLNAKHVLKIEASGRTPAAGVPSASATAAPAPAATTATGRTSGAEGEEGAAAVDGVRPLKKDALLPLLSEETELGRTVKEQLVQDGYAVLKGVLSQEEANEELDRMWAFVESVSPGVDRNDPSTWYPPDKKGEGSDGSSLDAAEDPWPHSGWKSFSDMFQTHGAGWLFGELREKLASRVFEPLYGTRELHTSKEGFTFHRPTDSGRHPLIDKPTFVCGKRMTESVGEHFDQGHAEVGLQHIQSGTCLVDQTDHDGQFYCWPGSHNYHQELTDGTWRGKSHWVPLTDEELAKLRANGLTPRKVPLKAGDVVLWRSDLAHAGMKPQSPTSGFRAVSYTAMQPAKITPPDVRAKKATAYRLGLTGDHVPSRENWHSSKDAPERFVPYFAEGPPKVSQRLAELYGLVQYSDEARMSGMTVDFNQQHD